MNNLFIVVGAAGVGKSQISRYVKAHSEMGYHIIKKCTTRPMRKEELRNDFLKDLDLIFKNEADYTADGNIVDYVRGGV